MSKKHKDGDTFECPHCEEVQDGPVEDFVIPGRIGRESRSQTQCHACDEWFIVTKDKDGTYAVD